jgi:SCY1-like protein 2
MPLFIEKSSPKVFRESIMPLVYNSLESEHAEVQERGLRAIPGLLDILDVSSVQEILFVKVAVRHHRLSGATRLVARAH